VFQSGNALLKRFRQMSLLVFHDGGHGLLKCLKKWCLSLASGFVNWAKQSHYRLTVFGRPLIFFWAQSSGRTGKAETAGCQNSIQKLLDLSFHFAGIIWLSWLRRTQKTPSSGELFKGGGRLWRVSDWWRHLRKHLGRNAYDYFLYWCVGRCLLGGLSFELLERCDWLGLINTYMDT